MLSAELRELTASEPLSLEEEYAMQKKWREDEDKLTFIILARDSPTLELENASDFRELPMIGDVNIFLKGSRDDPDFEAEVEIMIAEPTYRRSGRALSALQLMLSYATSSDHSAGAPLPIPPSSLTARIGEVNAPSIALFKKLCFDITRRVEVFQEVEMRFKDTPHENAWKCGRMARWDLEEPRVDDELAAAQHGE